MLMNAFKRKDGPRGQILLFALVLLLMAISFSGAAAIVWSNAAQTSDLHANRQRAFYISLAGLHKACSILEADASKWDGWTTVNESFGGGYYVIDVYNGTYGHGAGWVLNGTKRTVISAGHYQTASRRLSQVIKKSSGSGWFTINNSANFLTEE
jgi:hypothetical protein